MSKSLFIALGSVMLALSSAPMAQAQEQEPLDQSVQQTAEREPLNLGEWKKLASKERQSIVLASVESLFLAMSDFPEGAVPLDEKCLSGMTPKHLDKLLIQIAKKRPELPFVDTFLALTQCYAGGGQ